MRLELEFKRKKIYEIVTSSTFNFEIIKYKLEKKFG